MFRQEGSQISDKMHFIHWKISNLHRSIHTHTYVHHASNALIHFKPSISRQFTIHCPMCHKLSSEKETPSAAIKMLSVTIQMNKRKKPNVRCFRNPKSVCNIGDENSLKDKILFIFYMESIFYQHQPIFNIKYGLGDGHTYTSTSTSNGSKLTECLHENRIRTGKANE